MEPTKQTQALLVHKQLLLHYVKENKNLPQIPVYVTHLYMLDINLSGTSNLSVPCNSLALQFPTFRIHFIDLLKNGTAEAMVTERVRTAGREPRLSRLQREHPTFDSGVSRT